MSIILRAIFVLGVFLECRSIILRAKFVLGVFCFIAFQTKTDMESGFAVSLIRNGMTSRFIAFWIQNGFAICMYNTFDPSLVLVKVG